MTEKAREIAERLLALTGKAMREGDFATFIRAFHLPHRVGTFEKDIVIRTEEDMRLLVENVRAYYRKIGVTHVERYVVSAEFRSDNEIVSTHISHLMAGTRQLTEPGAVFSVTRKIGSDWLLVSSEYALEESHTKALQFDTGSHSNVLTFPDPDTCGLMS